jgi:hypothetical protein
MSVRQLARRLDKAEPTFRRRYGITFGPPVSAQDAMVFAIENHTLREEHFDAVVQESREGLRDMHAGLARERAETRRTSDPNEVKRVIIWAKTYPHLAMIEIVSHHPDEVVDPGHWQCIEKWASIPLAFIYSDKVKEEGRAAFFGARYSVRLMQTPDALELRREIWQPHPPDTTTTEIAT